MAHIQRKDGRLKGWLVRYDIEGKAHSKLYSDSVYGGKRKALTRARKGTIEQLKETGGMLTSRDDSSPMVVLKQKSNNHSGKTGVSLKRIAYFGGKLKYYWVAQIISPKKKSEQFTFSAQKYGFEKAKEHAIECRIEYEKAMIEKKRFWYRSFVKKWKKI